MNYPENTEVAPHAKATIDKLKADLASLCCVDMLKPPLQPLKSLRINPEDSPEERARKEKEYYERMREREAEREARAPELILYLDNVIKRIYLSRHMALDEDGGMYSFGNQQRVGEKSAPDTDSLQVANAIANFKTKSQYHCPRCGNDDDSRFFVDGAGGDTICMGAVGRGGCGQVVSDHAIDQGQEKRNFADKEDQSHHCPPPDKLMPMAENMRVVVLGGSSFAGAGSEAAFKRMRDGYNSVEKASSKITMDFRGETSTHYKTMHKKEAFRRMEQLASTFSLHFMVRERAKQEFARYRDTKCKLHDKEAVYAACMVIATRELLEGTAEGHRVLGVGREADIYTKKSVFVDDDYSKFQAVAAGNELQLQAQLDKDPAIFTNKSLPLRQWDESQANTWIDVVAQSYRTSNSNSDGSFNSLELSDVSPASGGTMAAAECAAATIKTHLHQLLYPTNNNTSTGKVGCAAPRGMLVLPGGRKRPYPEMPKGFGTTTIAGRHRKMEQAGFDSSVHSGVAVPSNDDKAASLSSASATRTSGVSAGRHLLGMDIAKLLAASASATNDNGANSAGTEANVANASASSLAAHFRTALSRRVTWEVSSAKAALVADMEAARMRVENGMGGGDAGAGAGGAEEAGQSNSSSSSTTKVKLESTPQLPPKGTSGSGNGRASGGSGGSGGVAAPPPPLAKTHSSASLDMDSLFNCPSAYVDAPPKPVVAAPSAGGVKTAGSVGSASAGAGGSASASPANVPGGGSKGPRFVVRGGKSAKK